MLFKASVFVALIIMVVFVFHLEKEVEEKKKVLETEQESLQEYKEKIETLKYQKTQLLNEIRFMDYTLQSLNLRDIPSNLNPDSPKIRTLAKQQQTPGEAFRFVRDEISYIPLTNSSSDALRVLEKGRGNCIEKASLLASLLIAQGMEKEKVLVSLGSVYQEGYNSHVPPENHAWVEVYKNGEWYVLDPTTYMGNFSPWQWKREDYYSNFKAKGYFVYSSKDSKLRVNVDPRNP